MSQSLVQIAWLEAVAIISFGSFLNLRITHSNINTLVRRNEGDYLLIKLSNSCCSILCLELTTEVELIIFLSWQTKDIWCSSRQQRIILMCVRSLIILPVLQISISILIQLVMNICVLVVVIPQEGVGIILIITTSTWIVEDCLIVTTFSFATILELTQNAISSKEKVLIFSQFTTYLSIIANNLKDLGISFYTITGATPKQMRVNLVNAFNNDDTPVFLVSLKAGGTGLNLTGASVVIHADPWWNAAAQNQATDRAHRIGQNKAVSVHKVITKDTIEERILALQDAKADLAQTILDAEGIAIGQLSADDLIELLSSR